jgi:isopentenyl-diphosphate delta-isomerase
MMDMVILVDNFDNEIGTMEKLEAHIKGELHRAFSVFILNSSNELLLQQRASSKYHSPDLWTNSCCSHPAPGEAILESANKRLIHEMGMQAELKIVDNFIYHCEFENGLIEHEFDYVIVGYSDATPAINSSEVKDYRWVSFDDLKSEMEVNPENFTFWFKDIIAQNKFCF